MQARFIDTLGVAADNWQKDERMMAGVHFLDPVPRLWGLVPPR